MSVLIVLGRYLPDKNGGIENYSRWLSNVLLQYGLEVEIAILNTPLTDDYVHEGIHIHILSEGFTSFSTLVKNNTYDICHFQEYSGKKGIDIDWFVEAKQYCRKVFFTFHLPYLTCYKNDFRYYGVEDCNNFSSDTRCVNCVVATKLHYNKNRGFNFRNSLINNFGVIIKMTPQVKKMKTNIINRKAELELLIKTCDNIFIYANWFKEILRNNGYFSDTIKTIPYITKVAEATTISTNSNIKNRILFVGRIEQQKGLHLLCKAMNLLETKALELDVFGNVVDKDYYQYCTNIYNFNFKQTLPLPALLLLLKDYDFLILPSVFTEMYSMIVKDAFFEKLPVIASAAKGNKDAITEGKNGFTFKYDDSADLAAVIDNGYFLKKNGWAPEFGEVANSRSDLDEITHYYL